MGLAVPQTPSVRKSRFLYFFSKMIYYALIFIKKSSATLLFNY
jgi:hypothetical protein